MEKKKKQEYTVLTKTKADGSVVTINRDMLKDLIRTKPFLQIGKEFGVSDNALF